MIKYNLICECGKTFESWFSSSAEYDDLRKKDPETVLYVSPQSFRKKTDQAIMPMSSISKKQTLGGNENGYYTVFQTDRYGFKNPDNEWDKEITIINFGAPIQN